MTASFNTCQFNLCLNKYLIQSHRQGSTTEDNRKIMHKEDRKERIQGQHLSLRQTSKTKDHTKISHREDRRETTQGQVSHRQGSTTEDKRKIAVAISVKRASVKMSR